MLVGISLAAQPHCLSVTCIHAYIPSDQSFKLLCMMMVHAIHQSIVTFSCVVRWIQSWATLVTAVSAYPASKSHLILDFIDYPDKAGLKWEANNGLPGSGLSACYAMACTNSDVVQPDAAMLCKQAWTAFIRAAETDILMKAPLQRHPESAILCFFLALLQ